MTNHHSFKLPPEFIGLNPVLEHLNSVDEDNRHFPAVTLAKRRVQVNVDLLQREISIAVGSANNGLCFFTKMAARSSVDCDYCFFHPTVRNHIDALDWKA